MPPAGKPPPSISHKRVWRLAGPVILSNLTIPLLSAVDTGVMGHLPDPAYIGGVAIGALIFQFVFWGFGFLRMATTGFVAQATGAGDDQEVRDITIRAGSLALVLSVVLIALQVPIVWVALSLIDGSAKVEGFAADYFAIRIWGTPATLLIYVGMGWLFGTQRMGTVMLIAVFMNGANVALDLLFVPVLGWGVEGVAAATIIAEYSAAILGWAIILRRFRSSGGVWRLKAAMARDRVVAMLRVNGDIFIRTLCLVFAFAWFTAQGAAVNDRVLAGNAILLNFLTFSAYGLDGFAHAAETLVGNAIGARDRARFRASVRMTTIWAGIVAVGFAVGFLALGEAIIAAMSDLPEVRIAATTYLPWVIISPLIGVWSFQMDGIFIGATRSAEMRNGMILSLAGMLAVGYALVPVWGNNGLWLAFSTFFVLRGMTLALWLPRIERSIAERSPPTAVVTE